MTTALEAVRSHAIEFGYLYDPYSGEPLRSHGRHLVRTTRDFPQGVLPVALPARLAGHVSALPYLVDPEHDADGALLILPSYGRMSPGILRGAWVTIQRLRLNPLADAAHLPGDAVRSSALIFDWRDYAAHAPFLHRAIVELAADQVSPRECAAARLGRPRMPVFLSGAAGAGEQTETAVRAIVGAVLRGARLRLDSRWCGTERDFIAAFLGALGRLPSAMRGHVSAAAGLGSADRGFQIVWCRDDLGLAPDGAIAGRLIELGASEGWADDAPDGTVDDDERFTGVDGLVSPTFDAPDLHAHVRRHIRRCFEGFTGSRAAAAAPDVVLARYVAGGDLSPSEADRLLCELSRPAATSSCMRKGVAAVLTGIASTACTLEEIAAALELCGLADVAEGDIRVSRVQHLAGQLISARLAEAVMVPDDLLSAATRRESLATILAREFAGANQRAVEPLRRALAGLAKRDRDAFRRIGGRVLPRDHRVLSVWNGECAEDFCLAGALFDAVATPRRVDAASMEALSGTLVAEGKWDLVREALLTAASGIPRGADGAAADIESLISRLRLVSAMARSMERNVPSRARTAA
jgi:hypothetical protein